jgi:hypothetical protein
MGQNCMSRLTGSCRPVKYRRLHRLPRLRRTPPIAARSGLTSRAARFHRAENRPSRVSNPAEPAAIAAKRGAIAGRRRLGPWLHPARLTGAHRVRSSGHSRRRRHRGGWVPKSGRGRKRLPIGHPARPPSRTPCFNFRVNQRPAAGRRNRAPGRPRSVPRPKRHISRRSKNRRDRRISPTRHGQPPRPRKTPTPHA